LASFFIFFAALSSVYFSLLGGYLDTLLLKGSTCTSILGFIYFFEEELKRVSSCKEFLKREA